MVSILFGGLNQKVDHLVYLDMHGENYPWQSLFVLLRFSQGQFGFIGLEDAKMQFV